MTTKKTISPAPKSQSSPNASVGRKPISSDISSSDLSAVGELCNILARVLMRVNSEQQSGTDAVANGKADKP